MMNRAAVAYIEAEDGRLLCVWNKRYKGWSLPGGKVEEGETPEMAVQRELEEETGLRAQRIDPIFDGPHGLNIEASRGSHVHIFRAHAIGAPHAAEEGCPITWLTREEFLKSSPFAAFYERVFAEVPPSKPCPVCGKLAQGLPCDGTHRSCWMYPFKLAEAQAKVIACARALDGCLGEFGDTVIGGECLCNACSEYVEHLSTAIAALDRLEQEPTT